MQLQYNIIHASFLKQMKPLTPVSLPTSLLREPNVSM
jgi:hypothetical protein